MNIKIWDLDENINVISKKEVFLDEKIIDDTLISNRKVDTAGLLGYCEEITIFNLKEDKEYAEKHEDKYTVGFTLGFKPVKNYLGENFHDSSWKIFRNEIDKLLKLFNLSSWRIGKGIVDRDREDIFIVERSDSDYPLWAIYFPLTQNMSYRKIIEMAKTLESFIKELKELIKGEEKMSDEKCCYIHGVEDANAESYNSEHHEICLMCAAKLNQLANAKVEFDFGDKVVAVHYQEN